MHETLYLFVIDTDCYAGNFARELTAWCTGQLDDIGITGKPYAEDMVRMFPVMAASFQGTVALVPNEQGSGCPCDLVVTPGYWHDGTGHHFPDAQWNRIMPRWPAYQSVGIFFHERPSPAAVAFMIPRARCYPGTAYAFTIVGFRLLRREIRETLEAGFSADYDA